MKEEFHIKPRKNTVKRSARKSMNLLKKYDINGTPVKTPMVPPNMLGPDLNGKAINETHNRDIKQILRNPTLLLLSEFPDACQLLEGKIVYWSENKQQSEAMLSAEADDIDLYSHQSHHDPNDSEKSLVELNNDVRNDLEDFKRCVHEWSKSQNISLEQTDRTDPPPPPPQAQTEHVDVVFTWSEMSDYSLEIQKGPPPSIIVNNKTEKD
ncbi:hypothetical protein Tco_0127880 [Tanacetum coccineum]